MRLLIVEDEIELCKSIAEGLTIDGYAVDTAYNEQDALDLLHNERYDLLILDINLPDVNGLEILKEVRTHDKDIRILMLSALTDASDKVVGLDLGANDYLGKPFEFIELRARIRSLLRRRFIQEDVNLKWEALLLNTNQRKLYADDKEVQLTKKEFSLIEYFMYNPNKIISAEELMNHVWNMDVDTFSNAVRVHIASLRKKLVEALTYDPIATKIGVGYYLQKRDHHED